MARKNYVSVSGFVTKKAELIEKGGSPFVGLRLLTQHDNAQGEHKEVNLFVECQGAVAIDLHTNVEVGDLVWVEGSLHTYQVDNLQLRCASCQAEFPYGFMHTCVSVDRFHSFGKSKNKFYTNRCFLLGNVVSAVHSRVTMDGKQKAKYQMALNREDMVGGADYPFVTSFGELAEKDVYRLRTGSQLLVDGFLQTSTGEIRAECTECGSILPFRLTRTNVFANSTEYLNKCYFPENDDASHWEKTVLNRLIRNID